MTVPEIVEDDRASLHTPVDRFETERALAHARRRQLLLLHVQGVHQRHVFHSGMHPGKPLHTFSIPG